MPAKDELHRLVHSMSKAEKRYFRIFVKKENKGPTNYERLFDALLAQDRYDEAAICAQFSGTALARRISAEKNYLFHLVLKTIRLFHSEQNSYFQMRALIDDLHLLYQRRLYRACFRHLRRLRKLVSQHHYLPGALELHIWERRLLKEMPEKQRAVALERLVSEWRSLNDRLQNYLQLYQLHDEFYLSLVQRPVRQDRPLRETLDPLFAQPILQTPPPEAHFHARHFYYQIHALHAQIQGDGPACLELHQRLIAHWDQHSALIKSEPARFKSLVANTMAMAAHNGKFDLLTKLRRRLDQLPQLREHAEFRILRIAHQTELIRYMNEQVYGALPAGVHQATEWFQDQGDRLPRKTQITFLYNLGLIHLLGRAARKSLALFHDLINISATHERQDLRTQARILQLYCHLELDNRLLVHDLSQNVLRSLPSSLKKDPIARAAITGAQRLADCDTQAAQRAAFAQLEEDLQTLGNGTNSGIFALSADLLAYATTHSP
ncbi:MAG: hypothetical protein AAGN35_08365 [Bacteroidota bacterium]